jgi:glycosyltransferase involved in cell wall biosynthesis
MTFGVGDLRYGGGMVQSDEPGVAVVIPTYNCASTLGRAIDSVLAQTWSDYRIFVADDGSTDATEALVQQYEDRITYVRQAHAGAAVARNLGISLSASRYVAFLDADDMWLPDKLERQVAFLESHPGAGVVCSDFSTDGRAYSAQPGVAAIPACGRHFGHLLHSCFLFTSAVMVRRACLDEVGCFHEALRVSEDYDLWLRLAASYAVAFLPEVLVHRHQRAGSLSSSTGLEDRTRNGIAALEHVLASSGGLTAAERRVVRRLIDDRYYSFGSYLLLLERPREGRQYLWKAWRARWLKWKAPVKLLASVLPAAGLRSLTGIWRRSIGAGAAK